MSNPKEAGCGIQARQFIPCEQFLSQVCDQNGKGLFERESFVVCAQSIDGKLLENNEVRPPRLRELMPLVFSGTACRCQCTGLSRLWIMSLLLNFSLCQVSQVRTGLYTDRRWPEHDVEYAMCAR